jgi:hypothetical protein
MFRSLLISLIVLLLFVGSSVFADTIVMIGAAVPFAGADLTVKERLEALGYDVAEHSQDEDDPVDISGAVAVFIGEALGSGNVLDGYKDVAIPVISIEAYVLDDMSLGVNDTFNGTDKDVNIVDAAHPIAGGLSGVVEVATEAIDICSVGDPLGDAQIVAEAVSDGRATIVAYEAGAADGDGNPLPARRVFAFAHANMTPLLTDEGWGLIERSVLWALGALSTTAVSPDGAVAATWGSIKEDYR